jgi:hypothetical protein
MSRRFSPEPSSAIASRIWLADCAAKLFRHRSPILAAKALRPHREFPLGSVQLARRRLSAFKASGDGRFRAGFPRAGSGRPGYRHLSFASFRKGPAGQIIRKLMTRREQRYLASSTLGLRRAPHGPVQQTHHVTGKILTRSCRIARASQTAVGIFQPPKVVSRCWTRASATSSRHGRAAT